MFGICIVLDCMSFSFWIYNSLTYKQKLFTGLILTICPTRIEQNKQDTTTATAII